MLENCRKIRKKTNKPMMDIDNKYKFIKIHECYKVFPHTLTYDAVTSIHIRI